MNKIILILEREFLTRVRKKSFIVMTILGPVLFALMAIVPSLLAMMDTSKRCQIAVFDSTSSYKECFVTTNKIEYTYLNINDKIAPSTFLNRAGEAKYDAYLEIEDNLIKNPDAIKLYSQSPITLDNQGEMRYTLENFLKKEILKQNDTPEMQLILKQLENAKIKISNITISTDGEETSNAAEIAMGISMILALLSYMLIMTYGAQVMKGVAEEKTNRIVEIIISSVKPFQLMMGKIIGIALVAFTQFLIWIVLTFSLVFIVQTFVLPQNRSQSIEQQVSGTVLSTTQPGSTAIAADGKSITETINKQLKGINLTFLLSVFGFYFIGGYLLYAALFAAVGSAIDPDSDPQQFVMPIMIPLILSLTIAMTASRDPHGMLAFWGSMIPLTSPIIMMARLPYNVPVWQLVLSMSLLVATFVLCTLLAAKIYRVGILMYGKKVTYKELWKWLRYK